MDFDWADELIHTFYGKRWLEHFLKKEGCNRTAREIKDAACRAVEEVRARATADDRADTERVYQEAMQRAHELATTSAD